MLSYSKVQGKSYVLQSLTGLNQVEFETLLKSFEVAWQAYIEQEYVSKTVCPSLRRRTACGVIEQWGQVVVHFGVLPVVPDSSSARIFVWARANASVRMGSQTESHLVSSVGR
jgi:hypothetical protein